jgi:hypothetical protein
MMMPGTGGSTGSWVSHCGRNENGHRNADNLITSPGRPGAAMHLHDYVGNETTSAATSDADLLRAATTCADGDLSTYFWPVLRAFGPGSGAPSPPVGNNHGRVLEPASVLIRFVGSPDGDVLPLPSLTRAVTGNARATDSGGAERVRWGCSGWPGRSTTLYPRCPAGQELVRTFDFPSCWDGRRTDSPTHRTHIVFPDELGTCPPDTFAVPRLQIELAYSVPTGVEYAIDTMPEQNGSPLTDHCDFINVMPESLMHQVVGCINSGRTC